MAYWEWGDASAGHVVLCVHGLSRQGRDFDVLAQALVARSKTPMRVVCPDVAGRGHSDWLTDPMAYQVPTYAMDMLALLAQLKPTTLDWVGTSMGGLIGMAVCGQPNLPLSAPVRRLVLNDVGPAVAWVFVERLKTYLGKSMRFASLEQAAAALWAISSSFGPHTPAQWLELSRHMVKPIADSAGQVALHYDPAIAVPVQTLTPELAAQGEAMLWHLYDAITAQTLLLRGADSDLLTPATAQAMAQRGPKAQLVEFAGVGHAPTLIAPDQVDTVASFLLA
jgi:pimeloyl-ACP methyl ester carboxylesterase